MKIDYTGEKTWDQLQDEDVIPVAIAADGRKLAGIQKGQLAAAVAAQAAAAAQPYAAAAADSADTALDAAASAAGNATIALGAKSDAQTAQAAAETAKAEAELAKTAAQTAQGGAETAAAGAESDKTAAETAASTATTKAGEASASAATATTKAAEAAASAAIRSGWVLLGSATANNSAQINVDGVVGSAYSAYLVQMSRIVPATASVPVELILRSSAPANIGGTYKSGYTFAGLTTAGNAGASNLSGTNGFRMGTGLRDQAGKFFSGLAEFELGDNNAAKTCWFRALYNDQASPNLWYAVFGGGYNADTTAVAGFALAATSGNLTSGVMRVYGLKNS